MAVLEQTIQSSLPPFVLPQSQHPEYIHTYQRLLSERFDPDATLFLSTQAWNICTLFRIFSRHFSLFRLTGLPPDTVASSILPLNPGSCYPTSPGTLASLLDSVRCHSTDKPPRLLLNKRGVLTDRVLAALESGLSEHPPDIYEKYTNNIRACSKQRGVSENTLSYHLIRTYICYYWEVLTNETVTVASILRGERKPVTASSTPDELAALLTTHKAPYRFEYLRRVSSSSSPSLATQLCHHYLSSRELSESTIRSAFTAIILHRATVALENSTLTWTSSQPPHPPMSLRLPPSMIPYIQHCIHPSHLTRPRSDDSALFPRDTWIYVHSQMSSYYKFRKPDAPNASVDLLSLYSQLSTSLCVNELPTSAQPLLHAVISHTLAFHPGMQATAKHSTLCLPLSSLLRV